MDNDRRALLVSRETLTLGLDLNRFIIVSVFKYG